MVTACLRRYQPIVIDGEHKILHSRVGEIWQLKDPKDGLITSMPRKSLLRKYEDGCVQFVIRNKLSTDIAKELYRSEPKGKPKEVAEEVWKLACAKHSLVKAVCGLGWQSLVQKREIRELWPVLTKNVKVCPLTPDPSSVYRWWSRLEEYGWDARALIPQHWKKGRRPEQIPDELRSLIDEGIEDEYLTQERKPREDAYMAVCILVDSRNQVNPNLAPLIHPTARQVYKIIRNLDAFDTHAARYGHETAVRKFRAVQGATVAAAPLERVELDHTVLDVIVLDDETLLPLGRPTIAIALDAYTRCVVGLYIGFEPPSISTVGQCLRSALTPKIGLLEGIPEIVEGWDAYGLMETLVLDQALENHADVIKWLAMKLGIEPAWCARKTPWQKGRVERFMRTLNDGYCHKIEGTTRSNILDKGDYDAVGRAVCTFSALRNGLIKWIVDVYHVRRHRALQTSPLGMWRRSISQDDIPLSIDLAAIEMSLRVPKAKPLTHKGIDCNSGLLYNSDELTMLRRTFGAELSVKVYASPSNLGDVIVEHEESAQRFTVPCLNLAYAAGLTLWQHKAIRKYAKDQNLGVASFDDQLRAKSSLEAIIYNGMADSPLKERVRSARMLQRTRECEGQDTHPSVIAASDPVSPRERTDVPKKPGDYVDEFDGVEMEFH